MKGNGFFFKDLWIQNTNLLTFNILLKRRHYVYSKKNKYVFELFFCWFVNPLSLGYGSSLVVLAMLTQFEGSRLDCFVQLVECNNLKDCRWFIGWGYCQEHQTSDRQFPVTKHDTTILFMQITCNVNIKFQSFVFQFGHSSMIGQNQKMQNVLEFVNNSRTQLK